MTRVWKRSSGIYSFASSSSGALYVGEPYLLARGVWLTCLDFDCRAKHTRMDPFYAWPTYTIRISTRRVLSTYDICAFLSILSIPEPYIPQYIENT